MPRCRSYGSAASSLSVASALSHELPPSEPTQILRAPAGLEVGARLQRHVVRAEAHGEKGLLFIVSSLMSI